MSLLWGPQQQRMTLQDFGVPGRGGRRFGTRVTRKRARHISVVWAAADLRAGLISSLPINVFKDYTGSSVPTRMPKPKVLITPHMWANSHPMSIGEWLYATQQDLDMEGNAVGVILERDGNGQPSQILPAPISDVVIAHKDGTIQKYLIGTTAYDPSEIWHERQYVVSGSPIGLSPIAHAKFSMQKHVAAEEFALDWFANGATPGAVLTRKGTKELKAEDADIIKRRFLAATSSGEPAVMSGDWTYTSVSSSAKQAQFLEEINASDSEILRFMRVPGDLVDLPTSGSSITYANITERNLQFLVHNLGPAIQRREGALSRLTLADRYVKLNTDAFLRMAPEARNEQIRANKEARLATVTESRALLNMPPLTDAQKGEIAEDAALAAKTIPIPRRRTHDPADARP